MTNNSSSNFQLAPLFQAVSDVLRREQGALNQADNLNGNHGDHMVEIFDLAARAVQENGELDFAAAMLYASQILQQQAHNGSAQLYARGLAQVAEQLRIYNVSLQDLLPYVHNALSEDKESQPESASGSADRSGDVLKALLAGLAAWEQAESGQPVSESPLDMGALFQFGMAYMQAKMRGGTRLEVLSDAAASVSPLSRTPHRYQSGKLAIQALLQAMQQAGGK